jgi:hypothetical protein
MSFKPSGCHLSQTRSPGPQRPPPSDPEDLESGSSKPRGQMQAPSLLPLEIWVWGPDSRSAVGDKSPHLGHLPPASVSSAKPRPRRPRPRPSLPGGRATRPPESQGRRRGAPTWGALLGSPGCFWRGGGSSSRSLAAGRSPAAGCSPLALWRAWVGGGGGAAPDGGGGAGSPPCTRRKCRDLGSSAWLAQPGPPQCQESSPRPLDPGGQTPASPLRSQGSRPQPPHSDPRGPDPALLPQTQGARSQPPPSDLRGPDPSLPTRTPGVQAQPSSLRPRGPGPCPPPADQESKPSPPPSNPGSRPEPPPP